jgi:hypothetical protein
MNLVDFIMSDNIEQSNAVNVVSFIFKGLK